MKLSQLAVQLYTVRDFCKTAAEFAQTASRLRKIGFTAVEIASVGSIPPAEVRRILDGEGLTACASHESPDVLRTTPEAVIERLAAFGCRHAIYPFPRDVDMTDPTHVDHLITDLARAGDVLSAAGLTLSYHNHALEFVRPRGRDTTVLDQLFTRTTPQQLSAELDTYWVQLGGGETVSWCRRLTGRLAVLHMKDYAFNATNMPSFAEIGAGNLDFRTIIAAAEASGCRWFVVEQDICPGDPFDSLRTSFDYIARHFLTS